MANNGQGIEEHGIDDRRGIRVDVTVRAFGLPPLDATLRDVSTNGAMLKADTPALDVGDEVVLTAAKLEIVATIAWRKRTYFGLVFHRRLDHRELLALRSGTLA